MYGFSYLLFEMQKHLRKIIFGLLVLTGGLSSCATSFEADIRESLPPLSEKSSPSPVVQPSTSNEFAALEQSVYQQVNQYRKSKNLPPLKWNPQITQEARNHSQAMASGKTPFSHDGFDRRVKAIDKSVAYRAAAENVAYNQGYSDPGKQAVQGWLKSPGHLKNIEGNFDLTGVGITKNAKGEYYLTQIFIKGR